jgi:hypothetical protein
MSMKKIEIDVEVHKAIESLRASFDQTPNDILREVFQLEQTEARQATEPANQAATWTTKDVQFEVGDKLQANYKGQLIEAEVVEGGLQVNGSVYHAPSTAACEVTGTSVNGWKFWKYLDRERGTWRYISELRS